MKISAEPVTEEVLRLCAGRCIQEDEDVVPAAVLCDQWQIPNERSFLILREPFGQNTEYPALAQAAANVAGIEENLHGEIRIRSIRAKEVALDLGITLGAKRADRREQVKACRTGAAGRHRAVLCKRLVRCLF